MKEVTAKSYTLLTESGSWLGQIVLTSDGMFAGVTDWGNFSFAWRSIGDQTIEEFICGLNKEYFADKMVNGFSYVDYNRKITKGAKLFAEKILPALKKELKKCLKQNP